MTTNQFSASALIQAPAQDVYAIIYHLNDRTIANDGIFRYHNNAIFYEPRNIP